MLFFFSQLRKSSEQPQLWYHFVFKVSFELGLHLPKSFLSVPSFRPFNILHASDKWPVQKGFLKNRADDLLPALRFLGRLCIIFVILRWYVEERHILEIQKWLNTTKKHGAEIASLRKLRTTQEIALVTLH